MSCRVRTVGNVIDGDRFTLAGERALGSAVRLLCVGNLIPEKGHIVLLRAVAALGRRSAALLHLTLVGSGPERGVLEVATSQLGIRDRVEFVDRLTGDSLVRAFQAADLFVLPSLVETFGVVAAEAMACGTPVVVTRSGGPEWFVTKKTGLVVEPGAQDALAGAISAAIDRLDSFDPLEIRREILDRFGVGAFVRDMAEVYQTVSSASDSGPTGERELT
jgi:glycosyltransferase involved in cell wall biosynthesis